MGGGPLNAPAGRRAAGTARTRNRCWNWCCARPCPNPLPRLAKAQRSSVPGAIAYCKVAESLATLSNHRLTGVRLDHCSRVSSVEFSR